LSPPRRAKLYSERVLMLIVIDLRHSRGRFQIGSERRSWVPDGSCMRIMIGLSRDLSRVFHDGSTGLFERTMDALAATYVEENVTSPESDRVPG